MSAKITVKPEPARYRRFLQQIELSSVSLARLDVKAVVESPAPNKTALEMKQSVTQEIKEKEAVLKAKFSLDFLDSADKSSKGRIRAFYNVCFRPRDTFEDWKDKKLWHTFSDINLPLIVWPYFRELVHSTMNRMGWPPLVLPLLLNPSAPQKRPTKKKKSENN